MKKILMLIFAIFFIGAIDGDAAPVKLKINDIQVVMNRFFNYHIENRELNPATVKRLIKLYIEQFDSDKAYLLEKEVLPYLQLSENQTQEIFERMKKNDYSDFIALNELFQKAIERFRNNRAQLAVSLSEMDSDSFFTTQSSYSQYAQSVEEVTKRQQNHMIRFFLYHQSRTHLETKERKLRVFALFDKKISRVENNYIYVDSSGKKMSNEQMEHLFSLRFLKAFAKSLDTHTSFFSHEEAQEMRLNLEKQFDGVGIILSEGIDGILIAELIEGSPAHQSGNIAVNDLLVEIDGHPVSNLSFHEVLELLKKKDRGRILLGFKRIDKEVGKELFFNVELDKRPITMQGDRIETSYEKVEGGIIGKISLHSFYESGDGESSEKDIKAAIRQFREKGELVGLVLDLRNNSGGFLSQAVKVAGLFLSNGVVVISKYGRGEVHYLRNIVGKSFYNGPLVVLTSKMSASAAEIVAQALQDYGVALIVGDSRTFGKGSIQYQTITDERADFFFKVTVGRYYTASGRSTQIEGVIPDIVLPGKYSPYKIGERYLEFPLPADHETPVFVDPLTDLDERTRQVFEKRYLPYLQRVVHYWKKMLPELKKNSEKRLAANPQYRSFLKKLESHTQRSKDLPANTIDDQIQMAIDDLQMEETVQIIKDMLRLEAEQSSHSTALAS